MTAPNKEKVYFIAGPEFGSNEGKSMIITRSLYDLKLAGAAFRSFLAMKLDNMSFVPTQANPDV